MSLFLKNFSVARSLTKTAIRTYAFKSDLKIKWVRPEKIPCYKPKKSGDLKPMPEIDKKQFLLEFQNSKELETADELTKKLFTLEFAPRWKMNQVYIKEMVDKVRRHPLDKGSTEARIARWTACIRTLQFVMEEHPHNKRLKVRLKELIDCRRKMLKRLRKWDYKRFEWLLEHMEILYKPPPLEYCRVSRKDSLRKLTQKYEDDIKNERLEAYRLQLEAGQPGFLEEKINTLKFIKKEQEDCGIECTVTQKEIDDVKKQLEELLQKRKTLKEG